MSNENFCTVQDTVTWLQKYKVRQRQKDDKLIAATMQVTVLQKLRVAQHFNVALTSLFFQVTSHKIDVVATLKHCVIFIVMSISIVKLSASNKLFWLRM